MSKIREVMDPEIGISIVDLGLIYDVVIDGNKVTIVMTLTTIGCPLVSLIESEIKARLEEINIKSEDIKIELTFNPPWSMEKMSPEAKAVLGIT